MSTLREVYDTLRQMQTDLNKQYHQVRAEMTPEDVKTLRIGLLCKLWLVEDKMRSVRRNVPVSLEGLS